MFLTILNMKLRINTLIHHMQYQEKNLETKSVLSFNDIWLLLKVMLENNQ
jgi:hypothetical protein